MTARNDSTEPVLDGSRVDELLRIALSEDAPSGDITTTAVLSSEQVTMRAHVVAKALGVVCGLPLAKRLAALSDPPLHSASKVDDGSEVEPGQTVMELRGPAASLLRVERPLLNILQHLSGIASLTARFVRLASPHGVIVTDTRKTLPGWRTLQRYAVRTGGGSHHRSDLSSQILIKENHVRALHAAEPGLADPFREAIRRARARTTGEVRLGVEAETAEEALAALEEGADLILLDDFEIDELRRTVERLRAASSRRPAARAPLVLEASGGIDLTTIESVARTGVDRVSVGALTHSAPALDLSFGILPIEP